ncbi:transposase [Deinococcus sp.]|uniref:transposase n=1 Tax=Deinococcus sp. TaxID=47478 RepID=UPI003B5911BA
MSRPRSEKGACGASEATGSNPTERGKAGAKRTLLTDGKGIPLAMVLSGANRHDRQMLVEVLNAVVIPLLTDDEAEYHLCLDRGYATPICHQRVKDHHLTAHSPEKAGTAKPLSAPGDPERHSPRRWVVEVRHAWVNRFRRLQVRWEKKASLIPHYPCSKREHQPAGSRWAR